MTHYDWDSERKDFTVREDKVRTPFPTRKVTLLLLNVTMTIMCYREGIGAHLLLDRWLFIFLAAFNALCAIVMLLTAIQVLSRKQSIGEDK